MVLPAITPLSWEFTARWFASIGGADQRQPGTETEQERGGRWHTVDGDDGLVLAAYGPATTSV